MKKLICVVNFLLMSLSNFAQITPEFEFTLHVEDSLGNKDSIILGYDVTAYPTLDANFGEVNIYNLPFDTILDVRNYFPEHDGALYKSKKNIIYYDCNNPFTNQINSTYFEVYSKYPPVKITWDSAIFQHPCREWSVIDETQLVLLLNDPGAATLMSENSMFNSVPIIPIEDSITLVGGRRTIAKGYLFIVAKDEIRVDVENVINAPTDWNISPNPSRDYVQVTKINFDNTEAKIKIISSVGQVCYEGKFTNTDLIDISNLPNSFYTIIIEDKQKVSRHKILKIE